MGSETERREAAAGLRELAAAPKQDWFRLAEALFGDRFRTRREIVGRLADLVEPEPERTCRMVDNGRELCCSVCDERHGYDDEPSYCKSCGAKVVDR